MTESSENKEETTADKKEPAQAKKEKRINPKQKKILLLMTAVFLTIGLVYLFYWLMYGRFFEYTDNAYVSGNVIPVTSQITGNVIAVNVDDTTLVKVGQPLVKIDPTDSLITLQQAKAALGLVVRQTQQLYINERGLLATIEAKQSNFKEAQEDLQRRLKAIKLGAVSKEELNHAQDSFNTANSALINAKASWESNQSLINQTKLSKQPSVMQASARLKQAYINYLRTTIYAPVTGFVSKRAAQVGQRVAPGMQLMAIVPLADVWVDANFKEKQLGKMKKGQTAELTSDIYGSSVVYHGKIVGFSGGTGSAFALLPPQNATGNWIKIVQRLPVRIAIDPKELQEHPLRVGLSMEVDVDISSPGQKLSQAPTESSNKTSIFDDMENQANKIVSQVIKENITMPSTDLNQASTH